MDREEKWRTTAKRWRNEKVHTLDDAQDEDLQQPRGREKNVGNASSPLPLPLRFVARTTLFLLSPPCERLWTLVLFWLFIASLAFSFIR